MTVKSFILISFVNASELYFEAFTVLLAGTVSMTPRAAMAGCPVILHGCGTTATVPEFSSGNASITSQ